MENDAKKRAENSMPTTDDTTGPSRLQFSWREGFNHLFGPAGEMSWDDSKPRTKYKLPIIHQNKYNEQFHHAGEINLLICGRTVYKAVIDMIADPDHPGRVDIDGAGFWIKVRRTGRGIQTQYHIEYVSHQEFIASQPLPNVPHLDNGDRILDI